MGRLAEPCVRLTLGDMGRPLPDMRGERGEVGVYRFAPAILGNSLEPAYSADGE